MSDTRNIEIGTSWQKGDETRRLNAIVTCGPDKAEVVYGTNKTPGVVQQPLSDWLNWARDAKRIDVEDRP